MQGDIDPALVERCVALVRKIASCPPDCGIGGYAAAGIAREIAALLPEPVDPDLIEALKMASGMYPATSTTNFTDGKADDSISVRCLLRGIKRGRQLEREGK